jgi:peptidoglycan/LPS O-acetylase OafA/YrhL
VWAAVLLAIPVVALADVFARAHGALTAGGRFALSEYHLGGLVADLSLVRGPSGLIGTLWSLQWEVWFSLLLPLYLVFVAFFGRRLVLEIALAVGCLLLVTADTWPGLHGFTLVSALRFMPMFGLGALMAVAREHVELGYLRATAYRGGRIVFLVLAAVLFSAKWWLFGITADNVLASRAEALQVLGAAMLVAIALSDPVAHRVLNTRLIAWLGAISFSLYLVHAPIVDLARQVVPEGAPALSILLAIPVSLGVAWLFWWAVERRFHSLARWVGRRAARRVAIVPPVAAELPQRVVV